MLEGTKTMIFRQLFDPDSWAYSYLLADPEAGDAVMIDPVAEQYLRDVALIREIGVKLTHAIDTHLHADHVTGAWQLREHTACKIVVSKHAGVRGADVLVDDGDSIAFGKLTLEARATPGHTPGCVTYVTAARDMAFTGDALLIRGAGRTDLGDGDSRRLFRSVREKILTLPKRCLLYPAHDYGGRTVTTVGEERLFNPRLGDAAKEEDFVGYMASLDLPHPRKLEVALVANRRCGAPEPGHERERAPQWGPVVRTFGGAWEISPLWVAEHRKTLLVLDVRSAAEADGELGRIDCATVVPLPTLRDRFGELDRARPIVTVCQSGTRSARAAVMLEEAGFERVANLSGGMLRWAQLGLPAVHSDQAARAQERSR